MLAVACLSVVLALTGAGIANALPGRSADSRQVVDQDAT